MVTAYFLIPPVPIHRGFIGGGVCLLLFMDARRVVVFRQLDPGLVAHPRCHLPHNVPPV